MGSEEQVLELMVSLDQALQETFKVEEKLDEYDCKLQVRISFEKLLYTFLASYVSIAQVKI